MKKVFIFLKKEFLEMLPPTIYFFIVFHIVAFIRGLMAESYGLSIATTSAATIGALITGKSILIADALPLFKWFRRNRIIYNVIWRIFLYIIIVLFLQLLEELIPLISVSGSFSSAIEKLFSEIRWTSFWATHLVLIIFLCFYTLITAIIETIGRKKFLDIFLKSEVQKAN